MQRTVNERIIKKEQAIISHHIKPTDGRTNFVPFWKERKRGGFLNHNIEYYISRRYERMDTPKAVGFFFLLSFTNTESHVNKNQ